MSNHSFVITANLERSLSAAPCAGSAAHQSCRLRLKGLPQIFVETSLACGAQDARERGGLRRWEAIYKDDRNGLRVRVASAIVCPLYGSAQ